MGSLSDIRKSISEMSEAELLELVRQHRASRRGGSVSVPGKKPTKKAVQIGKAINISDMSKEQAEALLKLLQEG